MSEQMLEIILRTKKLNVHTCGFNMVFFFVLSLNLNNCIVSFHMESMRGDHNFYFIQKQSIDFKTSFLS